MVTELEHTIMDAIEFRGGVPMRAQQNIKHRMEQLGYILPEGEVYPTKTVGFATWDASILDNMDLAGKVVFMHLREIHGVYTHELRLVYAVRPRIISESDIVATFAELGYTARNIGMTTMSLRHPDNRDKINTNSLAMLHNRIRDAYCANNVTGDVAFAFEGPETCPVIHFYFVPETKAASADLDMDLDSLSFDIDEDRLSEMQNAGMEIPDNDADCDGCKI